VKLLQVFCGLLIGSTVVSFGAVPFKQAQIVNPFAAYADVFPGQPKSAAVERGFSCPAGIFRAPEEYCFLRVARGEIYQVGVKISGGIIRQTDFTLRNQTLRLGDLILLWGMPQCNSGNYAWPSRGVVAEMPFHDGHVSPTVAVRRVSMR